MSLFGTLFLTHEFEHVSFVHNIMLVHVDTIRI